MTMKHRWYSFWDRHPKAGCVMLLVLLPLGCLLVLWHEGVKEMARQLKEIPSHVKTSWSRKEENNECS